jgi:hypothetical protein
MESTDGIGNRDKPMPKIWFAVALVPHRSMNMGRVGFEWKI